MSTTTVIGTISQLGYPMGVRDAVRGYLGGFAEDFDVDAIESELVALIQNRLPEGVVLIGEDLYADVGAEVELPDYKEPGAELITEEEWLDIIDPHDQTVPSGLSVEVR